MSRFGGIGKLPLTQKICLAGLLTALATILQKVLAINYLAALPYFRISFGAPAVIVFASIFLGPFYGAAVGAFSDILGYFAFDMSTFPYMYPAPGGSAPAAAVHSARRRRWRSARPARRCGRSRKRCGHSSRARAPAAVRPCRRRRARRAPGTPRKSNPATPAKSISNTRELRR